MGLLDRILGDTPSAPKTQPARAAERHTFKLSAPMCVPPRDSITPILKEYGIVNPEWSWCRYASTNGKLLPFFQLPDPDNPDNPYSIDVRCTLTVNKKQAVWVEYLIHRSQKVDIIGGGIEKKNKDWAKRHAGVMPKPWIQPGCTEAKKRR